MIAVTLWVIFKIAECIISLHATFRNSTARSKLHVSTIYAAMRHLYHARMNSLRVCYEPLIHTWIHEIC
jgi:hypothetical protein